MPNLETRSQEEINFWVKQISKIRASISNKKNIEISNLETRSQEEIDIWNKQLEKIKNSSYIPSFDEAMLSYNSELFKYEKEIEDRKVSDFLDSVESLWFTISNKVSYIIDKSENHVWYHLWEEVYLIYNNWLIEKNKATLSLKIWKIYYKINLNYKIDKYIDTSEANSFTLNVMKKNINIISISKKEAKWYKILNKDSLNWIEELLASILNNWRFNKHVIIND